MCNIMAVGDSVFMKMHHSHIDFRQSGLSVHFLPRDMTDSVTMRCQSILLCYVYFQQIVSKLNSYPLFQE